MEGGVSKPAFGKWKEEAVSSGLLLGQGSLQSAPAAESDRVVPMPKRGVSLNWLSRFCDSVSKEEDFGYDDASTAAVVSRCVLPALKSSGGANRARKALWELIPSEHTGQPTHMIVHAWAASFQETVSSVLALLNPAPVPNMPPPPPVDLNNTFVFLDIVAMPQGGPLGAQPDLPLVKQIIAGCSGGSVVAVDSELTVLTRMWCLYEIHCSVYPLRYTNMRIAFPDQFPLDGVFQFEVLVSRLDFMKSETSKADDKLKIISEVRHSIGSKRIQHELQECIVMQGRAALRWGNPTQMATYFCLLAKSGEWNTLQRGLMTIPEVAVDKKTLEEIKSIFKMFDADGSGELDEDEFIQVLELAGFKEEESSRIYTEVNTDGDDGISYEEFEEWWVETQRHDASKLGAHIDVSAASIMENLGTYISLLKRQGLDEHATFLRGMLDELPEDKRFKNPSADLPPMPLKTTKQANPDSVAWRLTNNDYPGTLKLIYELFLMNSSVLDANVALLPKPDVDLEDKAMCEVLVQYLDVFVSLINHYPARKEQSANFSLLAKEYQALLSAWQDGDALPRNEMAKGLSKKMDKNWLEFDVVRNMIDLKYGENQFVSKDLIQEAGLAVSEWLSKSKAKPGESLVFGVSELSRSYLGKTEQDSEQEQESKPKPKPRLNLQKTKQPQEMHRSSDPGSSRSDTDGLNIMRSPQMGKRPDISKLESSKIDISKLVGSKAVRLPSIKSRESELPPMTVEAARGLKGNKSIPGPAQRKPDMRKRLPPL